ncbi:MAG: hypothetical protein MUD14_21880 [Hydrococcus sp. Prado102]|jgi:hypothetical protein|nr:hypothetical protein [Hydrococcus sp. Prado102]
MSSPFDPINRGLIIIALVGLTILILAVFTAAAPDLIEDEPQKRLPILRIPLIGSVLALFGVGEVPILFLLGIYPFAIGTMGWGGNLLWYWYYGTYPTTSPGWWLVRLAGIVVARIFIFIAGRFRRLLRTHTAAGEMIPERFIGMKGDVLAVLGNGTSEVAIYDNIGKCQVQIYCVPWENATDKAFKVGDRVYIVDFIAPRRYAIVKFDSEDLLRAIALNQ